jgi:hypothetical protein
MKNMKEPGAIRIFGYPVTRTVITYSSYVETRIKERSGKTPCEMVETDLIASEGGTLIHTLDGRKARNKVTRLNDFSCEFHWLAFRVYVLRF